MESEGKSINRLNLQICKKNGMTKYINHAPKYKEWDKSRDDSPAHQSFRFV